MARRPAFKLPLAAGGELQLCVGLRAGQPQALLVLRTLLAAGCAAAGVWSGEVARAHTGTAVAHDLCRNERSHS